MDRVNRQFLVASTFIAIPAALLMASLSIGTHPEVPYSSSHETAVESGVQTAVGHSDGSESEKIRQVIGKQWGTPPRLSSSSRSSSTRSSSSEPTGLFRSLFGGRNKTSNQNQTRTSSRSQSSGASRTAQADISWEGIPFHDVNGETVGRAGAEPLAQPIRSATKTRVIRGGNESRKLTMKPTIARKPTPALSVPKPPAEASEMAPTLRAFSTSKSSRRSKPVAVASPSSSKSRIVSIYGDNLDSDSNYRSEEVADLVPRVRRRVLKPASAPQAIAKAELPGTGSAKEEEAKQASVEAIAKKAASKAVEDVAAEKAAAEKIAAAKLAAAKLAAGKLAAEKLAAKKIAAGKLAAAKLAATKLAAEKIAAGKLAAEKLAAEKLAAEKLAKLEAVTQIASAPKAELQAPTATVAKTEPGATAAPEEAIAITPAYSTPVDPATTPVPAVPSYVASGGIGSSPLAATMPKMPAASVSHRTGPPAAAFVPIRQPAGSSNPASARYPSFEERTQPNDRYGTVGPRSNASYDDGFNAVGSGAVGSDAVGSGIAQEQPVYETALARDRNFGGRDRNNETRGSYDPYGSRGQYQPPRMSTYGQNVNSRPHAVPAPAERELAPTRPSHETAAYPMYPIPGHQVDAEIEKRVVKRSSSSLPMNDQFTDASGNRMRAKSAAVAKLPPAGAHIVTSELPGIRVMTNGPSEVMIRQENEYEIRVENRGSIDAKGVLVRALIPDWADVHGKNATIGEIDSQGEKGSERLVWIIDNLPAGTSEQMFVRLMAARSGTHNLDVDWTLVPQRSVAQVKVHEPRLELAIEGPDQVVYGDSQSYKVRVLNPGDGVAANVVFTLSPNSATPQTQRIGDIPAGKEAQFEVELTAQDLGDLKIEGLARADLDLRAEGVKTIRVSAAKLEAIIGGPELKYQNTEAVYSLQLQNLGNATSEHVMASLRIPAGVKYLGGIDGAVQTRDMLKWEVQDLAPDASRDYQFRCNMIATGDHQFAFECTGTAAGKASVTIVTSVESIADLVLTISDPPAPAPIGSEVEYEIVVRNRGSREAKDVRTIAQFSHGIEPQRVEGHSGEVVTGQVLFDAIPRIAAGEEVRMRVIALAETAGHHRFRTEVRSGDTTLVAEEATHYMSPRSDRVSRRSSDAALTR